MRPFTIRNCRGFLRLANSGRDTKPSILTKRSIDLNREQLLALEIVFPYILDAETEQGSPKVDQTRAVVNGRTYLIVDQGESFELPHYVGEFHIVAFQEFSARRHIEKSLRTLMHVPYRTHTGLLRLDL